MESEERPIIFLDVDGVLNSNQEDTLLKDCCVEKLVLIVHKSNARIVLSSTWRNNQKAIDMLNEKFAEFNLEEVSDYTIRDGGWRPREEEIMVYVKKKHPSKWVILDDIDLRTGEFGNNKYILEMRDHFVHVNGVHGLRDNDVSNALQKLGIEIIEDIEENAKTNNLMV